MNPTPHMPFDQHHRPDDDGRSRTCPGVPRWMFRCTLLSGACALIWLVLRSGTKPSRITYPCQQAAFGTAALAFGAPVVATLIHLRRRLVGGMRTPIGKTAVFAVAAMAAVVVTVASVDRRANIPVLDPPADYHPQVYLVNTARGVEPGRFGGVDDLVTLMGLKGLKWHRSNQHGLTSGPDGLIDADSVVLIKINGQWPERGGTNTDVLRGVIRRIVEHPDGFTGEIVVADNGQGSGMSRTEYNAQDHQQSPQDVANDFTGEGWTVTTKRWDNIRYTSVGEYSSGDMTSGYVVDPILDPQTQIRVSYPKFQSATGTFISYKYGIWSPTPQTYDPDMLVVINIPVFKTHFIYAVTGAVKNHMGVVTQGLSTTSHQSVGRGGLGSVLADVRMPDLTILDCIWILARPGSGPSASYAQATRRDQLVAATDPVALDVWAAKFIMIPQIIDNGYAFSSYRDTQDPDNPDSIFRRYIDLSMNEVLLGGVDTSSDYAAVELHVWMGDFDRDGDVDLGDYAELFPDCLTGPGGGVLAGCEGWDLDSDGDVDVADFALFQGTFTGAL